MKKKVKKKKMPVRAVLPPNKVFSDKKKYVRKLKHKKTGDTND